MFSPEELEKVRDRVSGARDSVDRSYGRRFFVSMSTSSLFLALLIYFILAGPLAMAGVTIADVGGIHAEIDEVKGEEVTFYPVVGESSACPDTRAGDPPDPDPEPDEDALPMLRAGIGGATIPYDSEVQFTKDIRLPELSNMAGLRVGLTRETGLGNEVELGDASIEVTRLDAEEIQLQTDLVIDERHEDDTFGDPLNFDPGTSSDDPGGEFIFEGEQANIYEAEAVVHYLAFTELTLPELEFNLEYVENEWELNADDPDTFCPVRGSGIFVSILDIIDQDGSEDIDAGDTMHVEFEAANPGDDTESQWIHLDFGEQTSVNQTWISLDGEETTEETLSYDIPADQEVGEYDVTIRSDDSQSTGSVTIGDTAFFDVTIDSTNSPVDANDSLIVGATVENTGDFQDQQDVELEISDGVGTVDDVTLELNGSESDDVTLIWDTSDDDIGSYTANVSTDDDLDSADVDVISEDPYFVVDILSSNSPVVEGSVMEFDVEIENLGQQQGTQEINLGVIQDGEVYENSTDNITLTLDSQQSTVEDMIWDTDRGDIGEFTAVANSSNTTDDISVFVEQEVEEARIAVIGESDDDKDRLVEALESWLDLDRFVVEARDSTALEDSTASFIDTYDAFVVNKYEGDEWTDDDVGSFLDDAKAAETKVVSLENADFGVGPDAITRRSEATGYLDPDDVEQSTSGEADVQFEITQDHPIFEDPNFVGTSGDVVDLYDADGFGDRAWFTGFSDGDIYADIGISDEAGFDGPGAGVTADENEVLLSLGHQTWIDTYYDDSEKILANSIEFLVGPEPPYFEVEITGTNSPVDEEETLQVNASIENTGELADTQDITLEISDGVGEVDSESLSLGGEDSQDVTLEWTTDRGDAGSYVATVSSDNESRTTSVVVGDEILGSVLVAGSDESQYAPIRDFLDDNLDDEDWLVDQDDSTDVVTDAADYVDTYDTFVVNDYDRGDVTDTDIATFLDEVDADDSGIVHLENWGGGSDAVTGKVDARANPDSVEDAFDGDAPIELEIVQDDPIFDGVGGLGDRVAVYDGEFGDRAWFNGYTGDTLGEVVNADDGSLDGPGASREDNHCLLSLGNQTYIDGYTADGEQIITNCVTEVNPFPPIFEVEVTGSNSPVTEGEIMEVYVDVENVGDETGTQDVVLDIDGVGEEDVESVTLDGDATTSITLEWDTTGVADDDYTANVSSDDDFDTRTVTVGDVSYTVLVAGEDDTHRDEVRAVLDSQLGDDYSVTDEDSTDVVDAPSGYVDSYDVFVVNSYNRTAHDGTDIEGFLDEVDAGGAGIVHLELWGAGSDAVTGKVDARANPDSVEDAFDGEGPVEFEITQDHAIFDGVGGVGDRVEVYDTGFGDRAWFNGYTGDTLAEVVNADDGSLDGPGASVEGMHCLLSLGNTQYLDEYLTAGEQMMTNCVEETTPQPAEFDVTNFRYYVDEVADGQGIQVWADVENVGTEEGSDTLEYRMGGTVHDSTTETIAGGDTVTVAFTHTVDEVVGDTVTHGVYSSTDSDTADVSIEDADWTIPTTTDSFSDDFHHQSVEMKQAFTGELTVRAMSGGVGFENTGEVEVWSTTTDGEDNDTLLHSTAKSAGDEFASLHVDLEAGETYRIGHTNGHYRHNVEFAGEQYRTEGEYTDVLASYFDQSDYDNEGFMYGFSRYEMTEIDAQITSVSWDAFDSYEPGVGSYGADVTVENTGDEDHSFFVGFGVIDPNGVERDNEGGTGTFTATISPGQTDTVRVEWDVEDDAPEGLYDAATAVWTDHPDDDGVRLEDEWNTDAFEVDVDAALPLRTEDDWQAMASTFNDESNGNIDYRVDTTQSSVEGASGQFFTEGNEEEGFGEVVVNEDMSGEEWLAFDYESTDLFGDFRRAQVYIGGEEVFDTSEDTDGFETRYIDVSDFTGTTEISLRMATPDGTSVDDQELNYDNVRFVDETEVFNDFTPQPDIDFVVEGDFYSSPAPAGWAHDGDWFHDNTPIPEGEMRTYILHAPVPDGDIDMYLRDGEDNDPSGATGDIENEIHSFSDADDTPDEDFISNGRYDTEDIDDQEVVSVVIDYVNPDEVRMELKTTSPTGDGNEYSQTYDASDDGDVYFSTYEWAGTTGQDSLRISPDRMTEMSADGRYWSQDVSAVNGDGFDHDGDWVDDNTPIRQGEIRRYVYDEAGSTADVRAGLRDGRIGSDDSGRGATDLPGELVLWTDVEGSGLYEPDDEEIFDIVVDYSNPSEIEVRVNDDDVVETYDASGDDEVYWSVYEWAGGTDEDSLRLLPEEMETTEE